MKSIRDHWKLWLLLSLTLGLAPFTPEPHIWGKIKWVLGGAEGMKAMDWFDFLMHGIPWALLILSAVLHLAKMISPTKSIKQVKSKTNSEALN
jgi:hypothetical protein